MILPRDASDQARTLTDGGGVAVVTDCYPPYLARQPA